MRIARIVAALFAAALTSSAQAQEYFGQNQVQYDRFRWKVLETDHFLVYYYPEEADGITDAARMAERAYGKLTRVLNHQFREKKPIILFRSRTDFGQNNVTGDLGEGTGGVTEALRHRVLLPFTGDLRSFEHVLVHELVHAFQYDIFARGRAGNLQSLMLNNPPLWFAEGMAEYLSLGPGHVLTQSWIRDASLNGRLPTIQQMQLFPNEFFPYRFGEALWEYVGERWGDDVIGEIMNAVPSVGVDRAFKRELGLSLEELSDEWREAMQTKHLPKVATLDRARRFAEPLLNQRKSGGFAQEFLAPALSPDGKRIAFIAAGSLFRGEVFPSLWLGDGETGKRIAQLVKSTTDPDFEELRMLYSQSSFSPDGQRLAFTAQRNGKDVLYVLNVRTRKILKLFDQLPLDVVMSPSWSPDGKELVFSGYDSTIHDLYIIDVASGKLRQVTNGPFAELMPQWSPDGKSIAFVTDRGDSTDLDILKVGKWRIATLELGSGKIDLLPKQGGLNLNPMWAPDGKSIAYLSDRAGTPNLFLYDFDAKEQYQLTNVVGAISAIAEYSPAITWARGADRIAFTYFENGDYTVWSIANPRKLKKDPYRDAPTTQVVAGATRGAAGQPVSLERQREANQADMQRAIDAARSLADSTKPKNEEQVSLYRTATGFRPSGDLPGATERSGNAPVSVAALLDSAMLALPDTSRFQRYAYKPGLQPEYVMRPNVGYQQDNFGRGFAGGSAIVLSDMLGNNRLLLVGQVNGRFSEAMAMATYTNLANRFQYQVGASQVPIFMLSNSGVADVGSQQVLYRDISRYIIRSVYANGIRPVNRFSRWEYGLSASQVGISIGRYEQVVDPLLGYTGPAQITQVVDIGKFTYGGPMLSYVSDNTLQGYTSMLSGRRFRFGIEQNMIDLRWTQITADYRRYVPLIFNYLTFSWRLQSSLAIGRDENAFPQYIGRPDKLRGYDPEQLVSLRCGGLINDPSACSAQELVGSRFAIGNAELRFPLVRRFDVGLIPISLPPVDGLFFYDAGIAWSKGQNLSLKRPENYDLDKDRFLMRSYGLGIRMNLFGFAMIRWDYAIPLDRGGRKGYWIWTFGQSF